MTASSVENRPDRVAIGAGLIVFAVFLMALQDALIKLTSADLPLWQLYVLRSVIAIPALATLATLSGKGMAVRRLAFERWTMLRAILLVLMYISIYAAIPILPLSTLAGGLYTAPLFIAVLSSVLIGEPVRRRGWFAIALGFAGVLLILRPGAVAFALVALLPVLAGFFYALAAILTRSRCRQQDPFTLAMSLNIALLAAGALASFGVLAWQPVPSQIEVLPFLFSAWVTLELTDLALIATLAVLTVGIGIGLAAAYQLAPPAIIATFDYSYLIFATIFGFVLFSEVPDWPTVAGMVLIAGAGLMATLGS